MFSSQLKPHRSWYVGLLLALVVFALSVSGVLAQSLDSLMLVSESTTDGQTGNGESSPSRISADGRYVVFTSDASDLTGETNNNGAGFNGSDVYLYDVTTGTLTLLSEAETGGQTGEKRSYDPRISASGSYVVFESLAPDLTGDANNNGVLIGDDVYLYEVATGSLMLVSEATGGGTGDRFSGSPEISADGRYVVFTSSSNDLTGDVQNNGNDTDVYLYEVATGTLTLVSEATGGGTGDARSSSPIISDDGSTVVFWSKASDLVAGFTDGNGGDDDIYLYDMASGTITLVSESTTPGTSGDDQSYVGHLSADGSLVVFESEASDLTGDADGNSGSNDVYLYDVDSGTTTLISESTTPGTSGNGGSEKPRITPDGDRVVFESYASDLTGDADGNGGSNDVYLYNVDSGSLTLVSESTTPGIGGEDQSNSPRITADGHFVYFGSRATDLTNDTDGNSGKPDIYVRNVSSSTTTLVSESTTPGTGGNAASKSPRFSADGSLMVFYSSATDLTGDTDGNSGDEDVYLARVDLPVALPDPPRKVPTLPFWAILTLSGLIPLIVQNYRRRKPAL